MKTSVVVKVFTLILKNQHKKRSFSKILSKEDIKKKNQKQRLRKRCNIQQRVSQSRSNVNVQPWCIPMSLSAGCSHQGYGYGRISRGISHQCKFSGVDRNDKEFLFSFAFDISRTIPTVAKAVTMGRALLSPSLQIAKNLLWRTT